MKTGKRSHLLDVGTSFPYDVLVELFEDGNRNRKAVFNLRKEGRIEDYTMLASEAPSQELYK